MNRTKNCLELLVLLKSNSLLSTKEIARMLESNPRNVREYVKELEEAGYPIESVRGVHGGYRLRRASMVPLPPLSNEQTEALRQVRTWLRTDPSFAFRQEALSALNRILAGSGGEKDETTYHATCSFSSLDETEKSMILKIRSAILSQSVIEFTYQKLDDEKPAVRHVDPYELICSEGRWYICGFDHDRREFRNYRISRQRFCSLYISMETFHRDIHFRLLDHVGDSSIIRFAPEYFKVRVNSSEVRRFLETRWGEQLRELDSQASFKIYGFYTENPNAVLRELTRFGTGAVLLSPPKRIRQYIGLLRGILSNYE